MAVGQRDGNVGEVEVSVENISAERLFRTVDEDRRCYALLQLSSPVRPLYSMMEID